MQSTQHLVLIEQKHTAYVQDPDKFSPLPHSPNVKSYECFLTIVDRNSKSGKAFHDLNGQFPHTSNKYVLVLYDYDSNAILAELLKYRSSSEIKCAWLVLFEKLYRNGNAPKIYIMDNEASYDLKKACNKYNLAYQLVPPHIHCRNAAERAIQSFKNHVLA